MRRSPLQALATGLVLAIPLAGGSGRAAPPTERQLIEMLRTVDERQRTGGDWKALVYIEQKQRDKTDVVQEALIYRRDTDERMMILYTQPRSEQGKGYLRIDRNLWFYDPRIGRWERRTEREHIGGTDTRRVDFDRSRLAEEYAPSYVAAEKLGVFEVHHLKLGARPGVEVAFPMVHLWIDVASGNVLKRQELALSGRLMRTAYYPKWVKVTSEAKGGLVWYPREIRLFDEVEKANSTLVVVKRIDLRPLPENLFTKAWVESKSR